MSTGRKLQRLQIRACAMALLALATACGSLRNATPAATPSATVKPTDHNKPELIGGITVKPKDVKDPDRRRLMDEALRWLGTPYRYGGADFTGTDCSGMVMQVYMSALALPLPRNSAQQQKFCRPIMQDELTIGDLVFFTTGTNRSTVNHVGIYLGERKFIHASTSRGVVISSLDDNYYVVNFHSAGQVVRSTSTTEPQQPKPSTKATPRQQSDIDAAIEMHVDSIFSSFLE